MTKSKSKPANDKMEEDPRPPPIAADAAENSAAAADMEMRASIPQVEDLLKYRFKDETLLVEALTHSSYTQVKSNQRLQFLGDAVLGLAITDHIFSAYSDLDSGQLTDLRSANVCNKKFARVAIRHNLYAHLLRRNTPEMDQKVHEFTEAVQSDADEQLYHGEVLERKVLADMVEAIAAAVYLDCGSNLKKLWQVFQPLLEPIVTDETRQQHPVSKLNQLCQKMGKKLEFKTSEEGTMVIVNVYVDGKKTGSGRSDGQEIAKVKAANEAAQPLEKERLQEELEVQSTDEGAKQRLKELCDKRHWSKPSYK